MRRRTLLASSLSLLGTRHEMVRADAGTARRISALAPNQGFRLGVARVVGEFNDVARRFDLHRTGPRSRDYSRRMVWAPDRQRALFAGANHGAPHRLNDVWEFDLAAMTWFLLYAPDNPRTYAGLGQDASDVVFRDGVLQTLRGGPAVIGHTWSGITYDSRAQRMVFMNTWPIAIDPLVRQVGGDPGERFRGPPLWTFNPRGGSWSMQKTTPPWPFAAVGALLQDVPELGGQIWHMNNWQLQATWLLQANDSWKLIADRKSTPGFARSAPGRELVGYHDAKRQLVVAQHGKGSYHFDTRSRAWACIIEPGSIATAPDGHDAFTTFCSDPSNARGILLDFRTRELWTYDPDHASWKLMAPAGDPMPNGKHMLAYFDIALGVMVVLNGAEVWVWRPPTTT
jgi:hypothetical protein